MFRKDKTAHMHVRSASKILYCGGQRVVRIGDTKISGRRPNVDVLLCVACILRMHVHIYAGKGENALPLPAVQESGGVQPLRNA